jgi:hypothetical protein
MSGFGAVSVIWQLHCRRIWMSGSVTEASGGGGGGRAPSVITVTRHSPLWIVTLTVQQWDSQRLFSKVVHSSKVQTKSYRFLMCVELESWMNFYFPMKGR